jgi:hypothetical protein
MKFLRSNRGIRVREAKLLTDFPFDPAKPF